MCFTPFRVRLNAHDSKMTESNCNSFNAVVSLQCNSISIISRSYWIHAPNEMYLCTDNYTPRIWDCTQLQRRENFIRFTVSHVVYSFNMFRYKHFFLKIFCRCWISSLRWSFKIGNGTWTYCKFIKNHTSTLLCCDSIKNCILVQSSVNSILSESLSYIGLHRVITKK